MKKFLRLLYLSSFIFYLLIGCTSNVLTHQEFDAVKADITSIAVMPPDIEYFERNPVVTRPNPEYITIISKNVVRAIRTGFKGGTIEVHTLSSSRMDLTKDLATALRKVMQSYRQACEIIHNTGASEVGVVLDSEVKQLSDIVETNYLLFVRGKGYGKLSGEDRSDVVHSGMLGTASQWDGLMLDVALVDANTGDILWFNYNKEYQSQYQPLVLKSVQELCNLLLNDLIKLGAPEEDKTK
ncbi:MAG: hypothetical protein GWN00_22465 [Aliifodinibius sp.]|nr:hypothetical protein [Fodinibius sp.]NIV12803.1 hypothetical protein [Fodinibius sp.]NIY27466.1 hypothetical protein [Fodinibius sp.]